MSAGILWGTPSVDNDAATDVTFPLVSDVVAIEIRDAHPAVSAAVVSESNGLRLLDATNGADARVAALHLLQHAFHMTREGQDTREIREILSAISSVLDPSAELCENTCASLDAENDDAEVVLRV